MTEKPRILLVEDNPHIMKINSSALSMRGYEALEAESAARCRELLSFYEVDLIVMDVILPDGDGVSLCREIKKERQTPILFLSVLGENAQWL